jgi:hypothetical protein
VPVVVPGGSPRADNLEVIKTSLTVLAFLGALLTGLYAYRKQRLAEGDAARADAQQFSERYSKALDQLGNEQPAIRLGGVYAMARLADDWKIQRQTCIDVLCAYLRMPYLPPGDPKHRPGEDEVRKSIVRVIADHLRPEADPYWEGVRMDFTGAYLEQVDFGEVYFPGETIFENVTFANEAVFIACQFEGEPTDFSGAKFMANAYFCHANFLGTTRFVEAEFRGCADFEKARFSQCILFRDARLLGPNMFDEATFPNGMSFQECLTGTSDAESIFAGANFAAPIEPVA